jgi:hypothetical protein
MVWTDRGVIMDFPSISLDLANSIQNKLVAESKKGALKGATFPVRPASIVRYQHEHPELDMTNAADIAPKLGVSRLVYVEIDDFATRAADSVELYKGTMTCSMKIVEVNNGVGKIAFSEDNIKAIFPPKVPEDGTPNGDDIHFYVGTVDSMGTQIAWRLIPHQEER